MYKAALFLGAGGAVRRHVRARKAPPRPPLPGHAALRTGALAVLAPAAALGAAAALLYPRGAGGGAVLLLFAWLTASWAAWGWLRRRPPRALALAALAGLGATAVAYVLLLRAVTEFLAPALTGAGEETVAAWALAPLLVLLAVGALLPAAPARAAGALETLYVWALGAGHVLPRPARRPRAVRVPRRALPGPLVARSQGGRA
jgi:cation transport ATPase